jgi:peptidyl-prolyl cis-trans isomerase D
MLQRIHDSLARWIALALLGLVAVGFVFWRADFGTSGGASFAAKVNGENLPISEFDRELQGRQSQYQQLYRIELTEEMRRELRRSVLEDLIRSAALRQRIEKQGYRVSDQRLIDFIRSIPAFQVDGKFSSDTYRALLQNQGLTPTVFEAQERQSLEARELQAGIAESSFLTPAEFRRYIELFNQKREIGYAVFEVDSFSGGVTIDDAAIAKHYEDNKASYQTTETVDLEYVELALADIAAAGEATDEALRKLYDDEKDRFQVAEERRVRHILVTVPDGGEDAARAKADAIAARVRGGEDFAAVARQASEDAGTKAQGGELGWVARGGGILPMPFEDALFAMTAPNEIAGPIRSPAGFHIIQLEEIRPGEVQPFEAVRDQLSSEYRTQRAETQFYDRANELEDKAFTAYNELATVAQKMNLPLKTLMGFPRSGDPAVFMNSAPVVQAAFDNDILETGRNSGLLQLADDHVVVLRVTAHHPPADKPLAEVHDQIRDELKRTRAQELAEQAAAAFLADVEKGTEPAAAAMAHMGTWRAPAWTERTDPNVPTEILAAAFGLQKPKDGTITRRQVALSNGGQAVLALTNVQAGQPDEVPQEQRDQRRQELADQAAMAELTSYIASVREQATVRIPPEVLEPQY